MCSEFDFPFPTTGATTGAGISAVPGTGVISDWVEVVIATAPKPNTGRRQPGVSAAHAETKAGALSLYFKKRRVLFSALRNALRAYAKCRRKTRAYLSLLSTHYFDGNFRKFRNPQTLGPPAKIPQNRPRSMSQLVSYYYCTRNRNMMYWVKV